LHFTEGKVNAFQQRGIPVVTILELSRIDSFYGGCS